MESLKKIASYVDQGKVISHKIDLSEYDKSMIRYFDVSIKVTLTTNLKEQKTFPFILRFDQNFNEITDRLVAKKQIIELLMK